MPWPEGMQPRCVQTPTVTSHSAFGNLDFFRRTMANENRLAAPHGGDGHADVDRGQVHFGRSQRQNVFGGVDGMNERPSRNGYARYAEGGGGNQKKVTAIAVRFLRIIRGVIRHDDAFPDLGHRLYAQVAADCLLRGYEAFSTPPGLLSCGPNSGPAKRKTGPAHKNRLSESGNGI